MYFVSLLKRKHMQDIINEKPLLIEKENIPQLKFSKPHTMKVNENLHNKLKEATSLGNLHHGKCAIIFIDDEGLKKVETTIWATGAKYICLKGGVWLPIARISDVKFL